MSMVMRMKNGNDIEIEYWPNSYVWIATQSVIGETPEDGQKTSALPEYPAGMLGKIAHSGTITT